MHSLLEIEKAILGLDDAERAALLQWLEEQEADRWDAQMERDARAGRFVEAGNRAIEAHRAGLTDPIETL